MFLKPISTTLINIQLSVSCASQNLFCNHCIKKNFIKPEYNNSLNTHHCGRLPEKTMSITLATLKLLFLKPLVAMINSLLLMDTEIMTVSRICYQRQVYHVVTPQCSATDSNILALHEISLANSRYSSTLITVFKNFRKILFYSFAAHCKPFPATAGAAGP